MQSRRISISKTSSRESIAQSDIAALKKVVVEGVKKPNSKHGKRLRKIRQAALYAVAFIAIVSGIAVSTEISDEARVRASMLDTMTSTELRPTIDQIVETSVVARLAETANLPVATNVANMLTSLAIKHDVLQTDDISAVSKPQIINNSSLPTGVVGYKVQPGDTVDSLAAKHGVSTQTIRWANNMKADVGVNVGQDIIIPSVDGVVYTVKSGDTVDSLASRYKANTERIVVFNNLEVDGLAVGQRIVIPMGELPETERPGYVPPPPVITYNYGTSSGGKLNYTGRGNPNPYPNRDNSYAYGWCTWWVAERRFYTGNPIPRMWGNAYSWAYSAAGQGYRVDHSPEAGAILQKGNHVMYIESVSGGVVKYSEMNGPSGWNRVDYGEMSTATAATYNIIH
ncbi:MAG: LysM peptidoglycan-binding domain-containing protein [Candidatus Nomurabacteria bacterium]|jgi:surface antigen/murein DD-endopeptidase MepM/ murein hydrolase activator NlpD|nr:LysM peptidoglycan-binding domain-containing protein [Candidatus Nomurabacteria bacterium]